MRLSHIAADVGIQFIEDRELTGVSIDSRNLTHGSLFIALRGEHFDGHDFIMDAVKQGAAAILAEKCSFDVPVPVLSVENSAIALGKIAMAHRKSKKVSVIALTGSNGKTTVKEMISSIISEKTCVTKGNLNNHIGVPLSLLKLSDEHRYGVFELGANHPGEIAYTVRMVAPNVSLINNIAPAHIEGFGSIEGVARAKGEIYRGLSDDGYAIVNRDDAYWHFWDKDLSNKQVIYFSAQTRTTVHAQHLVMNTHGVFSFQLVLPGDTLSITLQVPGRHSVQNALAAAASCYALGISPVEIEAGLNRFQGVAGRLARSVGIQGIQVIDDTYNANPASLKAGLDVLATCQGQRILVLGDMGELGAHASQYHQAAGEVANASGVHVLMTIGNFSVFASEGFGLGAMHFETMEDLIEKLLAIVDPHTTVLIKGSRASHMERVVSALTQSSYDT